MFFPAVEQKKNRWNFLSFCKQNSRILLEMDDSTIKREVKSSSEDDSNDVGCADVFGETVKSDNLDEAVLVKPELLAEVSKTDYSFSFLSCIFQPIYCQ